MKRRHSKRARVQVFLALALALGVFTELNVAPAAAQVRAAGGAFCATQYGLVPSFTSLAPASTARGDTRMNEPDPGDAGVIAHNAKSGSRFHVTRSGGGIDHV